MPGSYLSIVRQWRNGDRVEMELPMHLYAESMPDDSSLQAVLYGPLVLAGGLGDDGLTEAMVIGHEGPDLKHHPPREIPLLRVKGTEPKTWLEATGKALTFRTSTENGGITFAPFQTVSKQRYSVYWNVT